MSGSRRFKGTSHYIDDHVDRYVCVACYMARLSEFGLSGLFILSGMSGLSGLFILPGMSGLSGSASFD